MIETVLFFILIAITKVIAFYIALGPKAKLNPLLYIVGIISLFSLFAIFLTRGTDKFNKDLSRIIKNSKPKSAEEVYSLLFNQPIDTCITFIHFKDQVIPKIDCCIWMELNVCPKEFLRIITLKKYQETILTRSNSAIFSSTLFRPASLVETTKPWRQPYKAEYRF